MLCCTFLGDRERRLDTWNDFLLYQVCVLALSMTCIVSFGLYTYYQICTRQVKIRTIHIFGRKKVYYLIRKIVKCTQKRLFQQQKQLILLYTFSLNNNVLIHILYISIVAKKAGRKNPTGIRLLFIIVSRYVICIFTVLQDQFWRPNIFENESLLHKYFAN